MAEKEPRTIVKEVPHAKLFSDGTIFLEYLRASYPHVLDKYKGDDDNAKAKHSIVCLMPKRKAWREAQELVNSVITDLLKSNRVKNMKADNKFFRDGDLAAKDEYAKFWTINASEANRVIVRDSKRDPKTGKPRVLKKGEDDDRIYAGCWVNVLIRPWFQNNKFGKKANAGLILVQHVPVEKVREVWSKATDDPFGNQRISEEEVDDTLDSYEEDEGYDDDDDDV